MRVVSALIRSALALVAMFVASTAIQAAAPNKPVEFDARVISLNTPNQGVKLSWMANREGDAPTHFDIYMAEGATEDESLFQKIGTKQVDPNNPPERGIFFYLVENLEPGKYTFFIRAVNDDGESPRSIIRVVMIDDPSQPKIDIVSTPPNYGYAGKEYKYIVKLMKNFDGGKATWTLVHGPDGMTISDEGVVVWPEAKAGRYEIKIKVEVEINGVVLTEDQSWVIEIKEGDGGDREGCVKIFGTVRADGANNGIMYGIVTAWRMERVTKDNGEIREEFRPVVKTQIQQGTYMLKVPAGVYKIRVEGEGFYAEWYEDAHELADAKNIEVNCDNPQIEVNFVVEERPKPTMHRMTGRVFDAVTNEGIFNALVTFEAREKGSAGYDDRFHKIKVETDADGNYAVELPEGMYYVASALVRGDRGTDRSLYIMEWWENTHDGTQAIVIEVVGPQDGYDFPMDKREVYDNGISGKLIDDSTEAGVQGKVTVYMLKDNAGNDDHKTRVMTVATDDQGNWTMTDLEPGNYIIFGTPGVRPYVPGWYVDGAVAAHSWQDATVVEVAADSHGEGYVIRFAKAKDGVGRGRIRGWVYDRRGGIIEKKDGVINANEGIMGSLVVVTDETGKVIDFAITENEGAYELLELGLGTWTIQADRVEYLPTTQSVTLDDQNLDVSLSIGLIKQVTSVEVPTAQVGTVYNLYPNPTNSDAVLSFPSTQGSAQISLITSAGVVVSTHSIDVVTGQTTVTLDTDTLPSGSIMVRVANGTHTFALPLQIVR